MTNRQLFLQHVAQTSAFPLALEIERAEGMYLYDTQGKAYMDLIAGISVSCLGHCHPSVTNAAKAQLDKYLHTIVYGEFVLAPQVQLAKLLSDNLPEKLDSVFFVNSGTEATEGAMKLAKRVTGRRDFVSCYNSYHGSTQGAMSLNSDAYFTSAFRPLLPNVKHIQYNCTRDLAHITESTAAVIMETVQAESGIHVPNPGYLQAVRNRCDAVGALLILDEIQVGYGRTGTLWAFEQHNVVPDILLLAKGMGGGMPIGAFVASRKMTQTLTDNPLLGHITTFGGHPVCVAAALATLETLLANNFIAEANEKEKLFRHLLVHPKIKTIRGKGLFLGVELRDFDFLQRVIQYCISKGLITDWFLFNDKTMRIAPPLVITEAEIRTACAIILEALEVID